MADYLSTEHLPTEYPPAEVTLPAYGGAAPVHLVLRPFRSAADYARCEALQRDTFYQRSFLGEAERGFYALEDSDVEDSDV